VCQEVKEKQFDPKEKAIHRNGTCHISSFNFFSSILAAGRQFIRLKNGNVGNFLYCFQRHHRGFKGKVDLNKKLAQKYTFVST